MFGSVSTRCATGPEGALYGDEVCGMGEEASPYDVWLALVPWLPVLTTGALPRVPP